MSEVHDKLKEALGPKGFSDDPKEIAPHLEEWRGKYHGHSPLLLKPGSTEDVAAIMRICNDSGTAIVTQGGNTGLVGGQIPLLGEIILSTARLNRIRDLDADGMTLVAEAGVTLSTVQRAAQDAGLLFPLSLASEGSCTIGGNIATNAGGTQVLRYGMMRALVLGLDVVTADGRVLEMTRRLHKDNTGYDLKQIFIGSEGTLGVVTAAALRLFPRPEAYATALVALDSPEAALALLGHMQHATAGMLSAFELVPRIGLDLVLRHIPGTSDPLPASAPWYVLVEASGPAHVTGALEGGLQQALERKQVRDAVIAASGAQAAALWKLRESLSEAQKLEGASIKHDVSVPVAAIPAFLAAAVPEVLKIVPGARAVSFGHMGDGNIHFNFNAPEGGDGAAFLAHWEEVQQCVHDLVRDFSGSISAEHGIGAMKVGLLPRYKSHEELDAMRALKHAFDPKGILNPGKLVPPIVRL